MKRYRFLRTRQILLATLVLSAGPIVAAEPAGDVEFEVTRIWNEAPHNAFTDLAEFEGRYYCTFREGTGHVPGNEGKDGEIRVLVSADGDEWNSFALLKEEGVDLRDPKLSVTPDNRLMLLIGGSYYEGTKILKRDPRVSFLEAGETSFGPIQPLNLDEKFDSNYDWLWRVTWHEGAGYGIVYQSTQAGVKFGLHLVKTTDGVNYDLVHSFKIEQFPNEATLRFLDDDTMVMLLRREKGDGHGIIGHASAPYTDWTLNELPVRLGGPNFIVRESGTLIAGTRKYDGPVKTILARITLEGDFEQLATLPSGGDTSYPGFIIVGDELWMSYYASHEGKTSIYLAKFPLSELPK